MRHTTLPPRFLFTLVLLLAAASCASAKVLYVKPAGSDGGDGLSWASAKKTIAAALSLTAPGDEVWVGSGPAYVERITLPTGVGLYGGFYGNETARAQRNANANPSIIDGGGSGNVVYIPSGISSTVLDGFTIRNSGEGASGVVCQDGGPTIRNNQIVRNGYAGIQSRGSKPLISQNIILQTNLYGIDLSYASGGSVVGCVIKQSGAAGIYTSGSSPLISSNLVEGNRVGMYVVGSNSQIQGNTIRGNSGNGGLWLFQSSPTIKSNVIAWNTSSDGGGLLIDYKSAPVVTNNTFVRNCATRKGNGGAITIAANASEAAASLVANNILAYNSSGIYRQDTAKAPTLKRNVFWSNGLYNYSGVSAGLGDLTIDPKFLSLAGGDYHLSATSGCINLGDPAQVTGGSLDVDGEPRVAGGQVDIGADEYAAGRTAVAWRKTVYVKASGTDAASGLSWAQARATIKGALAVATAGDAIWVASGTYTVNPLRVPGGVTILGGFAGTEVTENQRNAALNVAVLQPENSASIVELSYCGETSLLDGFTLHNSSLYQAVDCVDTTATISNCVIEDNIGLGINVGNFAYPTISGCTVRRNFRTGIFTSSKGSPTILNCAITANKSSYNSGGLLFANATGLVRGCTISDNTSTGLGGGISCVGANVTIESCQIIGNSVTGNSASGGGIYLDSSNATVQNCVIAKNSAPTGAGVKVINSVSPTLVGNTITGNIAGSLTQTGGIELEQAASTSIMNNIVSSNGGYGISAVGDNNSPFLIANCVFGNTASGYHNVTPGTASLTADPAFRDGANGDYRIDWTSPCVNAGDDRFATGGTDAGRNRRVYGQHVDIGAYEATPFGMVDFNGDGKWDAVTHNPSTGEIGVLWMNGTSITNSYSLIPALPQGWAVSGTGNFTPDGATGLAVQNLATTQISVLTLLGNKVTSSTSLRPSMLPNWQIRCTGDFDGDGKAEIVAQNTNTRDISVLTVSGSYVTASKSVRPVPAGDSVVAGSGDFDGNGTSDLLLYSPSLRKATVLYMKGVTITGTADITPTFNEGWTIVGVTDANGDARPDILAQNPTTQEVAVFYLNGTQVAGSAAVTPQLSAGWLVVGPR